MTKIWGQKELDIIKEYYPTGGTKKVKELLPHRGINAIAGKASDLGVKFTGKRTQKGVRYNNHYTPEEIKIIKEYYLTGGAIKCMEYLPNRSYDSIAIKARKLGLKCDLVSQRNELGLRHKELPKGTGVSAQGYLVDYLPDGSRILQHRRVMEDYLGRKLRSDEIIHHIDENKHNNKISNLKIVTRAEHAKIHHG